MPVVVLDANVIQIMGGHPGWVNESGDTETDPEFLRLPVWYQEEIRALSALNLAVPRLSSTAFIPPPSAIAELSRARKGVAWNSLAGWGGAISAWADRWFWQELDDRDAAALRGDWKRAQSLDLSFLRDHGDRAVARIAYALKSWYARVVTTDRKSFWRHRDILARLGIVVGLPSELWDEIGPCL